MSASKHLYQAIQFFEYEYPEPVRDVRTELRLFPATQRGGQRLRGRECRVRSRPDGSSSRRDAFGNEVWEFRHRSVDRRLRFEVRLLVEVEEGHGPGCVPAAEGVPPGGVDLFLRPTRLTDDSPAIRAAAREVQNDRLAGWWQVTTAGRWIYETLEYRPGVTGVDTPASSALGLRQGVCQDYAHVMLAICRRLRIPARYVSGFIPGEGYMHAWIEALVPHPESGEPCWLGYDPTHCRGVGPEYVTVAAGRDFADVSPISGTFLGAAPGRLTSGCESVPLGREVRWAHAAPGTGAALP
jgi:transglutaminase-like putative cysteine protease